MVNLDLSGNNIQIRFPYSLEQVERVKTLTSDWRKRDKYWSISSARLEEIYAVFPDAQASLKLRQWIDLQRELSRIKDARNRKSPQPYWVACALRDHQRSALEFLDHFSRCADFDPPGAMKTRVAAAWALHDRLPALVVCPATVKHHWKRQILTCQPNAQIFISEGMKPHILPSNLDFLILNYDILKGWTSLLPEFKTLICDESHYCKNFKSQRGDAILQLAERISNAFFLTGSPTLNRNGELESTLVALGYLKPRERFAWRVRFCAGHQVVINEKGVKYHGKKPIIKWDFSGSSNTQLLARELDMFSVRRPFAEIMASLPPVTHTLLEIDLPDLSEHEAMYAEMKALMRQPDSSSRGKALAMIGRMIAWCGVKKAEVVADLARERLDQGDYPVVFSDFLDPLCAVRERLLTESMVLDGTMTPRAKEDAIERFKDSLKPICLLASRRACGTGTDGLQTKSRTAIFQTLPWNPSSHQQAAARICRQGQRFPVEVITTLARGTVEEAVLRLIYEKARSVDIVCSSPSLSVEAKAEWERVLSLLGGI